MPERQSHLTDNQSNTGQKLNTEALERHAQEAARNRAFLHAQLDKAHESNPLNLSSIPRWEDEVGLAPIINRRVLELDVLPSPATVLQSMPLSDSARQLVVESREETRRVLAGADDRLLVLVGRVLFMIHVQLLTMRSV